MALALSQSSAYSQVSSLVHAELARPQSPKAQATPIKSDMASVQGAAALRSAGPQTRSMAAPRAAQASCAALKELAVPEEAGAAGDEEEELVSQLSEDFGDVVEAVSEGPEVMRVRRSAGKSAARMSRRRALVMCLALGMVRPSVGNAAGSIRRTAPSGLRRSASSSFTMSGNLSSQVSIASSFKAANLLQDEDDSAKL